MAEVIIKTEPRDCEFTVSSSETKESNTDSPQPKKECAAVLRNTKDESSQHNYTNEKILPKQKNPSELLESMQRDKSASQRCHDETAENCPEVFNSQEEVDITIDNVKIEDSNWINEPPTPEKAKEEDLVTKGEIEPSENKSLEENGVFNIQEDIEITIEDVKIEPYNKELEKSTTSSDVTKKHSRQLCSFSGCGRTKARYPTLRFFSFPTKRPSVCDAWVKNCANKDLDTVTKKTLSKRVVCEKHFEKSCFFVNCASFTGKRLHSCAVPTISSFQAIDDEITMDSRTDVVTKENKNQYYGCSVRGCINNLDDPSLILYGFPIYNRHICMQWINFCGEDSLHALPQCALSRRQICEKHFSADSFENVTRKKITKDAVPVKASSLPIEGDPELEVDSELSKNTIPIKDGSSSLEWDSDLSKDAVPIKVYLEPPGIRKIYFSVFDCGITGETLKSYFEHWGEVVDINSGVNFKKRLQGHITFAHSAVVDDVILDCPHFINGQKVMTKRVTFKTNTSCSKTDALSNFKCIRRNMCSFAGCQSRTSDPTLQFFMFPIHDKELCKKWILNCGDKVLHHLSLFALSQRQVCEKHFTKNSIESIPRRMLKKDAVPSIILSNDGLPCHKRVGFLNNLHEPLCTKKTKENQPSKHCTKRQYECTEKSNVKCTNVKRRFNIQTDFKNSTKGVKTTDDDFKDKGDNENLMIKNQTLTQSLTHASLFDDVLNLWRLPDYSELNDLSSHDEVTTVDPTQQHLTDKVQCEGTSSSSIPALKVKTPVRTYKRTAPKRQHPASWGKAENKEEKEGKVTKIEASLIKTHSEKEKNILDLSNFNRNNETNIGVKRRITAPSTSPPKGENIENAIGSTRNFYHQTHSCFYCNHLVSDIHQHLTEKHINEEEVKIIFKRKNKLTTIEFTFLTRIGDFNHNSRVIEKGNGLLISLGGRCHDISTLDKDTLMPCPDCAGFVHVDTLENHHSTCLFKDKSLLTSVKRNVLLESQAMLVYLKKDKFINLENYFSKRLNSVFGSVAKNDELIMLFIPYLYSSQTYIDSSAVLVLLQRLGFILQSYGRIADYQNVKFHHILKPECVKILVKALQSFFSQIKETERAGVYKSLYSHISVIAFIWRGKCLLDGNLKSAMEALRFFGHFTEVYEKELVTIVVSKDVVHSGSKDPKNHSAETLSLVPAEIISLKNVLNERIVQLTHMLCERIYLEGTAKSVWHDLAEATMCLLCLINPVDFLAIDGIKLTEYAVRPDSAIDDLTKYKSLIPPYCIFSEKQTFVCTRYLGSEVVITLPSTVKKAIDILILRRKEADIPLSHPFIFSGCQDNTLSSMIFFYNMCIKQKGVIPESVIRDLKKRRQISYIIHLSTMSHDEVELVKDYLKLSNDNASSLQNSPEDNYKSEINKEFKEALYIYEVNQGNL